MNRVTAACVRCSYVASALRPDIAMAGLLEHVACVHPDGPRPVLDANVVDEPKGQPS